MIRLLRFLFTGDWHLHEWETIKHADLSDYEGSRGSRWILRCKRCGEIKKVDCI